MTVSTPSVTTAAILSTSAFFGRLNRRTKCPRGRSARCQVSPSFTTSLTRLPLILSVRSSTVTSISLLPTPEFQSAKQSTRTQSSLVPLANRSHARSQKHCNIFMRESRRMQFRDMLRNTESALAGCYEWIKQRIRILVLLKNDWMWQNRCKKSLKQTCFGT